MVWVRWRRSPRVPVFREATRPISKVRENLRHVFSIERETHEGCNASESQIVNLKACSGWAAPIESAETIPFPSQTSPGEGGNEVRCVVSHLEIIPFDLLHCLTPCFDCRDRSTCIDLGKELECRRCIPARTNHCVVGVMALPGRSCPGVSTGSEALAKVAPHPPRSPP